MAVGEYRPVYNHTFLKQFEDFWLFVSSLLMVGRLAACLQPMFPKRTFGLFVSGLLMDWAICRMRIFFLEERLAGKGETIKVRRSSVLILWIFVPS